MRFLTVVILALAFLGGCSTYRDHLNRGQRLYDENEFERALAIWRVLEDEVDSLDEKDHVRYAYLRGMTDYRLKFRTHARHWLAIAKALDEMHPGGLTDDWKRRADEALEDLNKDVYGSRATPESESDESESDESSASEPAAAVEPAATVE